MIPIRDSEPSGITPYVTIGLMVLNILGFLLQLGSGDSKKAGYTVRADVQGAQYHQQTRDAGGNCND